MRCLGPRRARMGLKTASVLTKGGTPSQLRDSGGLGVSLTALSSFDPRQKRRTRLTHYGCFSQGFPGDPMAWTPWHTNFFAFSSASCLLG